MKVQPLKLALDSKVFNKAIHKNKYQTSNIDTLIDSIYPQINDRRPKALQTFYTSIIHIAN